MKLEDYREGIGDRNGFSVLRARLPFRRGFNHSQDFCIQVITHSFLKFHIADSTIGSYGKLYQNASLNFVFDGLLRIFYLAVEPFCKLAVITSVK